LDSSELPLNQGHSLELLLKALPKRQSQEGKFRQTSYHL
jgi:hypothetical protein